MDKELEKSITELIQEWGKANAAHNQITDWRETEYGKHITVRKLIAEYCLRSFQIFPYTKCKLRIWEENGVYYGYLNIAIRDSADNTVDGVAGTGTTAEEAFNDVISGNIELILKYEEKFGRKLTNEDYEYIDLQDF